MADPDNSRFIGGPLGARAAWASLSIMAGAWGLHGFGNFSVLLKSTGQWIGRAGPWMPPGWPGPEIGWAFLKENWGEGYASEAARATMIWSRDVLGWDHVIHIIHRRIRLPWRWRSVSVRISNVSFQRARWTTRSRF